MDVTVHVGPSGTPDYKPIEEHVFIAMAQAIKAEKHLLEVGSLSIQWAYNDGYAVIALNEKGEGIGYSRLQILCGPDEKDGGRQWLELGTTWVHSDHRNRDINKLMYTKLLPLRQHLDNILATTTNPASIAVGDQFGFVPINRKQLPEHVWKKSCCCPLIKTGAADKSNHDCTLAHGEPQKKPNVTACWFRVTQQTAEHLNLVSCMA